MVSHYSNIMAKKFHSMQETPEKKKYQNNSYFCVKKFFSLAFFKANYGKLAWVNTTHQRLNMKISNLLTKKNTLTTTSDSYSEESFKQWLVGFTDGDGCFNIYCINDKYWSLTYKLTQSKVNAKILYYIKKELKCGTITEETNKLNFRVRDLKILENVILPIFDKYPLLTSKFFDYLKFKEILNVLKDPINYPIGIIRNNKIREIIETKKIPKFKESWVYNLNENNILSPIWENLSIGLLAPDFDYWNSIISKSWLIGFIEAEGSLFITRNSSSNRDERMLHGFAISQKKDKIILEGIKKLFHTPSKLYLNKDNYYLISCNNRVNLFLIEYFKNSFKGIKSLQYSIWSRSLIKSKNIKNSKERFEYLKDIQSLLRKLVNNSK